MSDTSKNPLSAWLLLILLALVWGTSFILMKKSLATYSVTEVAAGRLFLASLFFLPIMLRTRVPRDRFRYLLISSLMGYVIPAFLFSKAGTRLNSSLSGMLNSLSPLFTLIIGFMFYGQPRRWLQVVGILIGLLGSLLLIFAQKTGSINLTDPYALLIVSATVMYGININTIVRYLSHLPALAMTAWTFAFIGPISLVALLTSDFFPKIARTENLQPTLYLLVLGIMGSGLAAILFNRIVQLASGIFASSVTYLIPMVAIGWGLWDGENITLQQFLGMGVILTGIYLVNKK